MGAGELTHLQLDVYDTKEGPWNPEHGELVVPDEWEFLPRGDAYVTRRVKAGGTYWLLWQPRRRTRPHRRLLGLWAPRDAIEQAQALAEVTVEARGKRRVQSARQRDRQVAEHGSRRPLLVTHEMISRMLLMALLDLTPDEALARSIPHGQWYPLTHQHKVWG